MGRRSDVVRLKPRPRARRRRPRSRQSRRGPLVAVLLVATLAGLVAWNRGLTLDDLPDAVDAWLDGAREGPGTASGGPLGRVSHVRDGDIIEVAGVAVRIANLDCAERGTAEGRAASARMRELVAGEAVACELEGRRSHDREVGTCALARTGEDLGEILIGEGTCDRWR